MYDNLVLNKKNARANHAKTRYANDSGIMIISGGPWKYPNFDALQNKDQHCLNIELQNFLSMIIWGDVFVGPPVCDRVIYHTLNHTQSIGSAFKLHEYSLAVFWCWYLQQRHTTCQKVSLTTSVISHLTQISLGKCPLNGFGTLKTRQLTLVPWTSKICCLWQNNITKWTSNSNTLINVTFHKQNNMQLCMPENGKKSDLCAVSLMILAALLAKRNTIISLMTHNNSASRLSHT